MDMPGLWKSRRCYVRTSLSLLMAMIVGIVVRDHDTAFNQQALFGLLGAYTMILGSYLGFATWHDVSKVPGVGESTVTATMVETHSGPPGPCHEGEVR